MTWPRVPAPLRAMGWLICAGLIAALCLAVGLVCAQHLWGGRRVTRAGEAFGFRIGMTRPEVATTYRELGESTNLRSYTSDGEAHYPLIHTTGRWELSEEFLGGDRWMGYRKSYPIWYQEFHFEQGRLVQIITDIRFYELP